MFFVPLPRRAHASRSLLSRTELSKARTSSSGNELDTPGCGFYRSARAGNLAPLPRRWHVMPQDEATCPQLEPIYERTVDPRTDRKSTRLNSSHSCASRMPSSACKKKNRKRLKTIH